MKWYYFKFKRSKTCPSGKIEQEEGIVWGALIPSGVSYDKTIYTEDTIVIWEEMPGGSLNKAALSDLREATEEEIKKFKMHAIFNEIEKS